MLEGKVPKLTEFFKDKRNILILALVFIVLGELIWGLGYLSRPLPFVSKILPKPRAQATLALSPSLGGVKAGETFTVEIKLEAASNVATDGVDVVLTFDQEKLEAVQVQEGNFYSQVALNSVDNQEGVIKFSALTSLDQEPVKGGGTVATITFKALKTGTAQASFDFTPASTKDSNVAQPGTPGDILQKVINGSWVIVK